MIMVEMSKIKGSPQSSTLSPGLLPEAFELSARVAQAPPRVRSAPCSPAQNHMNRWTLKRVNIKTDENQSRWTSSSSSREVSSMFTCAGLYVNIFTGELVTTKEGKCENIWTPQMSKQMNSHVGETGHVHMDRNICQLSTAHWADRHLTMKLYYRQLFLPFASNGDLH